MSHETSATSIPQPAFRTLFTFSNMELIIFQAEETRFVMPKHVLNRPGTFFEGMFAAPAPLDEDGKEIGNEKNIIFLEKIAEDLGCEKILADDFEAFLHVLYPCGDVYPSTKHKSEGYEYWLGVLKLSTLWEFETVKQKAIYRLTPILEGMTPIKSVWLGRKYQVSQWIRRGFVKICADESLSPVTLGDPPAQQSESHLFLDWKSIAYICQIRCESYKRTISSLTNNFNLAPLNYCLYCLRAGYILNTGICRSCGKSNQQKPTMNTDDIDRLVKQYFQEEV